MNRVFVTVYFILFVTVIFYGFEIKQRVDGTSLLSIVCQIHPALELGTPFGHRNCTSFENYIKRILI